jgi:hypothetical protein
VGVDECHVVHPSSVGGEPHGESGSLSDLKLRGAAGILSN